MERPSMYPNPESGYQPETSAPAQKEGNEASEYRAIVAKVLERLGEIQPTSKILKPAADAVMQRYQLPDYEKVNDGTWQSSIIIFKPRVNKPNFYSGDPLSSAEDQEEPVTAYDLINLTLWLNKVRGKGPEYAAYYPDDEISRALISEIEARIVQ